MKKVCLGLFSLFLFGCASISNADLDNSKFDKQFLTASYFFNNQEYEKAAKIYRQIFDDLKDSYIALKLSETYLADKKPEQAKEFLLSVLNEKKFKDNPEINFYLGKIYIEYLSDIKTGKKYLDVAIENSDKEEYLQYWARVLEASEDYSSAIKVYTKLLNKNNNPEYYYKRGSLYIKLGIMKEGINDLIRADELTPNLRARLLLSDVYLNEKDYKKAAEYLEKTIELNSQFPSIKIKLAEVYKELGNYKRYIEIMQSVLNQYKGKQKIYLLKQIANSYYNIKDYDNAIKYFNILLKESPDDTQALFYLGVVYETKGEIDKALTYYEKAYNVRNDYFEPIKRIAYIYYKKGDYKKALESLKRITEDGKDIEYYSLKSAIYEDSGDLDKALDIVKKGLDKNPESEELIFQYAVLKEKSKDYQKTIELLKKLLEINPENPTYLNFLGYLYADLGINLNDAYDLITKALKYDPDNSAYLDSMAWVYYKMKKYKKAYDYQLKALRITPDEKEMREHMQAILKALNIDKTVEDVLKK